MARERYSLVSEDQKKALDLEARIRSGEINFENFSELSPSEQAEVNRLLFQIASEKIEPNTGASVLEFILFGFMRVISKKVKGMSLTEDEKHIEQSLNEIIDMHELSNGKVQKEDWLFDYMSYAKRNSEGILQNRKEHIDRKIQITGKV